MASSAATWTPAYVALGSNLQDPATQVRQALQQLLQLPATRMPLHSSLYWSKPMGPQAQPMFVNAVAALLTQLDAHALLTALQQIEVSMGRQTSTERWGPRVIDLDLLIFGTQQLQSEQLQLPHPGMLLRNFVLVPLAEIAPCLQLPNGRMAADVARETGWVGLQKLEQH